MSDALILSLKESCDPRLVGGKASGLAKLIGTGFAVPAGFCVTTAVYRHCLEEAGIDTAKVWKQALHSSEDPLVQEQARIREVLLTQPWPAGFQADLELRLTNLAHDPSIRWAVRSSATNEDARAASAAGLYRTTLGRSWQEVLPAIRECWISLWDAHLVHWLLRFGGDMVCPAMAVIIQPMLNAQVAGVAFSIHPVTGRTTQVVINAVPGLAALLVNGNVTPDQYVVEESAEPAALLRIRRSILTEKRQKLVTTPEGVRAEPIPSVEQRQSSLSEKQLFELARLA
ncbi:MAG: PEP/pyruvate-binding domain-containing protein, partial [Nitrospira sp.]|nr:PEP/pyruvate-binding domain-containing protein [Nitrospira sp.]